MDVSHRALTNGMAMASLRAVRSAIDNGTYKVNAGAIADKLLSNAQEVLQRGASQ